MIVEVLSIIFMFFDVVPSSHDLRHLKEEER